MHEPDADQHADKRLRPFTGDPQLRGLRLGELLVKQGVLTASQAEHVLDVQAVVGRPFGDLAERLFGIPPFAVTAAWVEQFAAIHGERDVSQQPCDPACLALLTTRQAWQFRLVPMYRELEDTGGGHLVVAAGRRGLRKAMTFAARTLPIAPSFVLATPQSLQALLCRHYPLSEHMQTWAMGR